MLGMADVFPWADCWEQHQRQGVTEKPCGSNRGEVPCKRLEQPRRHGVTEKACGRNGGKVSRERLQKRQRQGVTQKACERKSE